MAIKKAPADLVWTEVGHGPDDEVWFYDGISVYYLDGGKEHQLRHHKTNAYGRVDHCLEIISIAGESINRLEEIPDRCLQHMEAQFPGYDVWLFA